MLAGLEEVNDGRDPDRRPRRHQPGAQGPRHRDGVPVLRPVPAHDRARQHGLRAADRRHAQGRDRDAASRRPPRSSTSSRTWTASPRPCPAVSASAWPWAGRSCASPQVFLMDEPLSNLDAKLRVQTRTQIAKLQRDLGVTTVYVTHDQTEAMTMGDRIAVLKDGLLMQVGTPQELYDTPANVFVAGFIGSPAMNIIEAPLVDGGRSAWATRPSPLPAAAAAGAGRARTHQRRAGHAPGGPADHRRRRRPGPSRSRSSRAWAPTPTSTPRSSSPAAARADRGPHRRPPAPRPRQLLGLEAVDHHTHVFDPTPANACSTEPAPVAHREPRCRCARPPRRRSLSCCSCRGTRRWSSGRPRSPWRCRGASPGTPCGSSAINGAVLRDQGDRGVVRQARVRAAVRPPPARRPVRRADRCRRRAGGRRRARPSRRR